MARPNQCYLTPEQLTEAERLYRAGQTKPEIVSALGISNWAWEECRRPGGPLAHLPSRQGQRSDIHRNTGLKLFVERSTPAVEAEVESRRRAVAAGWDEPTRQSRMGLPNDREPWDSQRFSPCPARGTVPVRVHHGRW